MIYINSVMSEILNDLCVIDLADSLQEILDKDFVFVDGMFFLNYNYISNEESLEVIKDRYGDISGFEFSMNAINIDDCVNNNIAEYGYEFFKKFKIKWISSKLPSCYIALSIQLDKEFGDMAKFTFYIKRDGQDVIDVDNIDDYPEPLLVEII